jgi:hypothetical protein
MSRFLAGKNRRMDMSLGSNPLEHPVEVVAQLDDCVEGHAQMPTGAQLLNHFREPSLWQSPAVISQPL